MEREYLQKWLEDIEDSIKHEEASLENLQEAALWPGASHLSEIHDVETSSNFSHAESADIKMPVEERLSYYKARSQRSLQQKRQQQVQEELDNVKDPIISKRSQKLAKNSRDGKIEDRLLLEGQKQKSLQTKKEAQITKETRLQSNPVITPLAASLKREGDIVDRLFEYQKIYQDKLETKKKESINEPDAVPKINKSNINSRYMKPISPKQVYVETFSYKPEVSKRSEILAQKLGDSKNRLLQKPKEKQIDESEYTFKPSIIRREEDDPNKKEWWENLYQQGQFSKDKRERLKEEFDKMREEDPNLTFKPVMHTKNTKNETPDERLRRLEAWNKQKEEKIEALKAQSSNKDLEGCTFAPKINKRPSTVKHNPETRGVNKFLERQKQAKERKYETETPKKPKIDDLSHNDYERALRELHEELHTIT